MSVLVERTFGTAVTEVAEARLFLSDFLSQWGLASDDAVLVVSELASNAVLHSSGGFAVALRREDDSMIVEVTDTSSTMPRAGSPSHPRGGRGLLIVQRLANDWGVRIGMAVGKTVWAEMPVTQTATKDIAPQSWPDGPRRT